MLLHISDANPNYPCADELSSVPVEDYILLSYVLLGFLVSS